jgi:hypothetical protein
MRHAKLSILAPIIPVFLIVVPIVFLIIPVVFLIVVAIFVVSILSVVFFHDITSYTSNIGNIS